MKKLSLVLIAILLAACSTSNDSSESSSDLIIGVWKPVKVVDVYNNGNSEGYTYSTCQQKSRYTFTSEGVFSFIDYREGENGNCSSENNSFEHISGSWEKISDGRYKLINTYYYFDTEEFETETDSPDEVSFPDSNTQRVKYNDGYEDNNGVILEYSYTEFIRVN